MNWASLEVDDTKPLFPVEQPDGDRHLSELDRVVCFRRLVREHAPEVAIYPNANAGRRSPFQAAREGIVAGVFDYTAAWTAPHVAWLEFKGYDARGRAGQLSPAQIEWGNRMVRLGHRVACFFTPASALAWLEACGAPIRIAI